jgi:hypothetical protein
MSKIEFEVPTHDPHTGELNPYYKEMVGKKNPLELTQKDKIHLKAWAYIPNPTEDKDIDKMPNQKWHQIISFIKSGVRIVGYILIPFDLVIAASVLVFSEIIGIVEELV